MTHLWLWIAMALAVALFIGVCLIRKRRLALRNCGSQWEPRDATAKLASMFLIAPFVQLGDYPALQKRETVELRWHGRLNLKRWTVQVKVAGEPCWRVEQTPFKSILEIPGLGKHCEYFVAIGDLPPGAEFEYRIMAAGELAFHARAKARTHSSKFSFAVPADIGEFGDENFAEHKVAHQLWQTKPDFVIIDGDIAYPQGRVRDYMKNVFPVYNSSRSDPSLGAPILRSRIAMVAPGNHDMGMPHVKERPNFTLDPDSLGYFLFWNAPLNGPCKRNGANTPPIKGDWKLRHLFATNAGDRFPLMGMYSFDWGNAHFTVLDSNAYVDWTDEQLRDWVKADLASARNATWRLVVMHHPAFSSHLNHAKEQRMRLLCDIFEAHAVDVVFNGHNHCYERSHPLRFKADKLETKLFSEHCPVPGTFEIDTKYDGTGKTRPDGILYVGVGASGAAFNPDHKPEKDQLKPFTAMFDQTVHSFSYVAIDGGRFEMRQIDESGKQIDGFVIQK